MKTSMFLSLIKAYTIFLLCLLSNCIVKGQMPPNLENPYSVTILEQLKKAASAIIAKDYNTQITFIYPTSIEQVGGIEKMIMVLKKADKTMELKEEKYKNIIFGGLSKFIDFNGEIQCTILKDVEIDNKKAFIGSLSTIICISKDNGKNWYFIDTLDKDQNIFKEFSNLSDKLIVRNSIMIEANGKL